MKTRNPSVVSMIRIIIFGILVCLQFASGQNDECPLYRREAEALKKLERRSPLDTVNDLRKLLVDLAVANSCPYMTNRTIMLASMESEPEAAEQPDTGNLWVEKCSINQVGPDKVEARIEGKGWQWIKEVKEIAGAEFELAQIVCFEVDVSTTVTFDLIYDIEQKIATIYFNPTEPVQANFVVMNDIDVESESLWSSIVGQVGEIVGKSTVERAVESIIKTAENKIVSKLECGFTVIVDLCTSQVYTRIGKFPAGILPIEEKTPEQNVKIDNDMVLHPKGLLMAGPFDPRKGIIANFQESDGAFQANWLCLEEAHDVVNEFVKTQQVQIRNSESVSVIEANQYVEFIPPENLECPLYLVMVPLEQKLVKYDLKLWFSDDPAKALVKCQ